MTKKQIEEENVRLKELIKQYEKLIDAINKFDKIALSPCHYVPENPNDCPAGGEHEYVNMGTAGTQCKKCFKRLDFGFPTIIC
jgi:hypothetical protein